MVRKVQTAIMLEPELKQLVDSKGLNLSRFVCDALRDFFSVSTTEEVDTKIMEQKMVLAGLEAQRKQIVGMEESVYSKGKSEGLAWGPLREAYHNMCLNQGNNFDGNEWITRPRNIQYCRILKMQPALVLLELRDWMKKEDDKSDKNKGKGLIDE